MTTTEQINHLISLLIAKRDGKKIERHCANCGPDYVCPRCKEWTDFRPVELCRYQDCYRIAPEPAPTHQTVCAHCKEVIQPGTCHISWGTPSKHEICISQTIIGRDWTPAGVEERK